MTTREEDVERVLAECWQNLMDKDDRNSPGDYPDHCLITRKELGCYILEALASLPPDDGLERAAKVAESDAILKAWDLEHPNAIHTTPQEMQRRIAKAIRALRSQPPQAHDAGHPHLIDGEFQSDKYPSCPRGKVPLSCKDKTAQDLLWEYAQRRRAVDAEFADDLEMALKNHGYAPQARAAMPSEGELREIAAEHFDLGQFRSFVTVMDEVVSFGRALAERMKS